MIPDISHHHTVKDWDKVKDNCPFIITKATQGKSFVDSSLKDVIKHCEKRNIPYWVYVYLNKGDELAQTRFMVDTCKSLVGKNFVGYIIDVEAGNKSGPVKDALEFIEKQGHKCMIYTMYADYANYRTAIVGRGKNTAWWEARYGRNNGKYNGDYPCHNGVDLHQFTSNGKVSCLEGAIDLNRVTGTGKNLKWFTTPLGKKAKKNTIKYYHPIKSYKGDSIVEALNRLKINSSFEYRKKIAKANKIKNYTGTASQNLYLLKLLRKGKLIKP